jgi:hypothetical protein
MALRKGKTNIKVASYCLKRCKAIESRGMAEKALDRNI